MLKLSKKTDYAIILLTHLGGQIDPVSAQEVASFYKLPYPMVANILKQLVSSGLIKSNRGQNGGYVLGRSPDDINLSENIAWIKRYSPDIIFCFCWSSRKLVPTSGIEKSVIFN